MQFKTFFVLLLILITTISAQLNRPLRYETNPDSLENVIKNMLNQEKPNKYKGEIFGLVLPHYTPYASDLIVKGLKQIEGKNYNRIIILCNSHRQTFRGIGIDAYNFWDSPFGRIEVDRKFAEKLTRENNRINLNSSSHRTDHTTEMLLPYLELALEGTFKIVPILFGNSFYLGEDDNKDYQILSDALIKHLEPGDLIIVSSDLSHFYTNADETRRIDQKQLELISQSDLTGLNKFEKKLFTENNGRKKILNCAIDGIRTLIEISTRTGVKKVNVLGYDMTGEDWDNEKFCGFSSIVFIK